MLLPFPIMTFKCAIGHQRVCPFERVPWKQKWAFWRSTVKTAWESYIYVLCCRSSTYILGFDLFFRLKAVYYVFCRRRNRQTGIRLQIQVQMHFSKWDKLRTLLEVFDVAFFCKTLYSPTGIALKRSGDAWPWKAKPYCHSIGLEFLVVGSIPDKT